MKKYIAHTLLVLGLCTTISCEKSNEHRVSQTSTHSGQKLNISLVNTPSSLDPRNVQDSSSLTLARMLYDGLTKIDPQGKVVLSMAKDVEISPDHRTYTFHLKDDALWSNGQAVTAYDFVNSWKKSLTPQENNPCAHYLFVIDHAKQVKNGEQSCDQIGAFAVDDKTLLVHLEKPLPYFLEMVANPIYFPVPKGSDVQKQGFHLTKELISNGPFAVDSWDAQGNLILKKNNHYWDAKKVSIEEIALAVVSKEEALQKFKKGELQWVENGVEIDNQELTASGYTHQTHLLRFNPLGFPFNDPQLRKAFSMAVQSAVNAKTSVDKLDSDVQRHHLDVDRFVAQKMVDDFLKRNHLEELPTIQLMVQDLPEEKMIASFAKTQWEEALGVNVNMKIIPAQQFNDEEKKQNYHISTEMVAVPAQHPLYLLDFLEEKFGDSFIEAMNTQKLEQLRQESLNADPNATPTLVALAQELFDESAVFIPIHLNETQAVHSSQLKNVVFLDQGGVEFHWASLE